ncbi:replication-associated protein [Elk circovirus Banff/2019]|uniref:Replication-associated protein n=1 Tax=Elk circovirus Banff/2019 TaxID=2656740 RepID=A0A6G5X0Z9_9CIRC|nr:replication-associated protein [Elk circovirus Banff/2019]QGM49342.1 replication-associated protein [Elk circovirus Banff/2019]
MVNTKSGPAPNKRWVFTLNNPSPEEETHIANLDGNMFDYFIVGIEGLGEGRTRHLQGFANFVKKKTFNQVKRLFGIRCHIEKAKGTDLQNKEYCSKENTLLVEVGAPRYQGRRSDLSAAVSTALERGSLVPVAELHPETFVRYHRGLSELLKVTGKSQSRDWKTAVHVIVGPPGSGKSRWAAEFADKTATYWKPSRNKWWDGYNGQEVVVLDDYYGWLPFDDLLRLCDRYPLTVETKGGTVPFLARSILITSNKEPQEWYSSDAVPVVEALYRRITTLRFWKTHMRPSTAEDMYSYEEEKFYALSPPCNEFPYKINY